MRLLAIDGDLKQPGSFETEALIRLLERVFAREKPDRLFVFGQAAIAIAGWAKNRQAKDDDAYLDAVARHLLRADEAPSAASATGSAEPPERREPPAVLQGVIAVGPDAEALVPLRCTDRAMEMHGRTITMAIAKRTPLQNGKEDPSNATFWVTGGERQPLLQREADVTVLSPGFFGAEIGALRIDLERGGIVVTTLDPLGDPIAKHRFDFSRGPRLSVQSA